VGEPIKATSETVAEKNSSSSHILKALVEGKVLTAATAMDESSDISLDHLTEEDLANAYTTTIKTETGQDVIIIITQPGGGSSRSPAPSSPSPSPSCDPDAAMLSPSLFSSPDYHYASSSDYEWSPSPAAATRSRGGNSQPPQRKKYQRKNKPTLVLEPYPRYNNTPIPVFSRLLFEL
jgi:hypothetical protein